VNSLCGARRTRSLQVRLSTPASEKRPSKRNRRERSLLKALHAAHLVPSHRSRITPTDLPTLRMVILAQFSRRTLRLPLAPDNPGLPRRYLSCVEAANADSAFPLGLSSSPLGLVPRTCLGTHIVQHHGWPGSVPTTYLSAILGIYQSLCFPEKGGGSAYPHWRIVPSRICPSWFAPG
jgi:hypothetical protein